MGRLIVLCATLTALLIGSFAAARAVGNHLPPHIHAWFKHADGTPCAQACLFGITPDGALSFEAARQSLAAHPITQGMAVRDRGTQYGWRSSGIEILIGRAAESDLLAWINVRIDNRALVMADVIVAYGIPDYVVAIPNSIITDLLYLPSNLQVSTLRNALPENQPLRLTHSVYNLYLQDQAQFGALLVNLGGNLKTWRGLVDVTRYYNRPSRVAVP
ncbi:MAG: hypothetical protein DYG88_13145 [Chloroflexi bacterium CFX4]|nr:hypothetical protein [Chloroflexi bacterium CFX4]MDL1923477.1 hypothetical protein [Chloroflexi bacterium CFX3]